MHQVGELIGTHKLTEEQVKKIWALRYSNLTAKQIKDIFNLPVSTTSIKYVRRGKGWKHVTDKLR
jgi:hypothetical protein